MHSQKLVKRFESLESERASSIEQVWDLIEQFVLPFRGEFYTTINNENEIDWHRRDIYDSTAVFALQSLAASIHGNLTSPSDKWFDLKFRDEELNSNDSAMEWLESCGDICFEALMDSNFNVEISEAYIDMGGYGSTVLVEEAIDEIQWEGLLFTAVPIHESYFEEDFNGNVLRFYRKLMLTADQIISKFGKENDENSVPRYIREMAAKGGDSATKKHAVIYVIEPREGKEKADTSTVLAVGERPYRSVYILKKDNIELGDEGGYYEMPAFVGRWRKTAGSKWGHSPAFIALGDILTLNQLIESVLEALGKNIDPTILADEGALIGNLDLDRGTLNTVLDINGVRVLESGSKFDSSTLHIEMLRESIRKAFYQDQLELKDSPQMTATEVNVRYEMIQKLLGPTAGRIQHDILDKLIERTFKILFRARRLPELPKGLKLSELDIEYTGPLPRSQKMETAMAIDRWMMSAAEKAEVFPEVMDLVDVDEAERIKANLLGVPAKAVRSKEQIKQLRADREEQQQKQQALMTAEQGGNAAKAVGEGMQAINEGGGMPSEDEIASVMGGNA